MNNEEWELLFEMEHKKNQLLDVLLDWVEWARKEIELLKIHLLISYKDEILDYMIKLKENILSTLKIVQKNLHV